MVIESVIKTRLNRELIEQVAELYIGPSDVVLDATYGRGKWWNGADGAWRPDSYLFTTNDLDPSTEAEFHHDFRILPAEWRGGFDVIAFDPPYIPKGGRETSGIREMDDRYGLYQAPKNPAALWYFIEAGIASCARCLAPRGRLLVKCSDFISSGEYQDGYPKVLGAAAKWGLKHVDTFIHHSGTGPQPPGRRQVHSRRSHSYLVVFEKRSGR